MTASQACRPSASRADRVEGQSVALISLTSRDKTLRPLPLEVEPTTNLKTVSRFFEYSLCCPLLFHGLAASDQTQASFEGSRGNNSASPLKELTAPVALASPAAAGANIWSCPRGRPRDRRP